MIKNNKECTEDRFLNDVKDHKISIVKDDGVHRFIRFKRPNTNSYWFDINTWPGFLCISGDMGTYVFSRLNDMFEFFRADPKHFQSKGESHGINPGYWGEKLQAIDRFSGFKEFDSAEFESRVKEHFTAYIAPYISDELRAEIWTSIEENILTNWPSRDAEKNNYRNGSRRTIPAL